MIDLTSYLLGKKSGGGGGSTLIPKTITQNGNYNPIDDNANGYNYVSVNVPNTYVAGDEGKVVSSGELVSQTSTSFTQNGVYDTTLNNLITVNVSGVGEQETVFYAFKHNPTGITYSVPSYGIKFIPKMVFSIKGIRIKARGSSANVYLSLADGTLLAQKANASVTAGEWNDVFFDNPITLTANTEYVMWASDSSSDTFSVHGALSSKPFITFVESYKSNTADTFPTISWGSWSTPDCGGVDLIISKTGTDKYPFYSQLWDGTVPYQSLSLTATIKYTLPDWVDDFSTNTKNFINDNCYGATSRSSGSTVSYTLDDAFTAFSYNEYSQINLFDGEFVEYNSYIYGSSLLSQYNITLLGDFSQGGSETGNVLSDSITNYSAIILQGVYQKQRTSNYNTTTLYPVILNESFWAGMKDRNSSYTCNVTFTDATTCSLSGNKQVIIYGIE